MNYYLHDDPDVSPAWAPWFAHEYITYFSTVACDWIMALPPVRVQANPSFGDWPEGPEHVDIYKERYRIVQHIDHNYEFDYSVRNGEYAVAPPSDISIPPRLILILYPTEPDLQLDCGLDLHWKQKITGGSHGLRHMRFKALGLTVGTAPDSLAYYIDASTRSFRINNPYWGWRFMSRATHYLADLGHPFHVSAGPLKELFSWPFSAKKLFQKLSAMHHSYEVYAELRFRNGFEPFKDALIDGSKAASSSNEDLMRNLKTYQLKTKTRMAPVYRFLKDEFGDELIDAFRKMDDYEELDASKQTMKCSADAAEVIFKKDDGNLAWLDEITREILYDVGFMIGLLFKHIRPNASDE